MAAPVILVIAVVAIVFQHLSVMGELSSLKKMIVPIHEWVTCEPQPNSIGEPTLAEHPSLEEELTVAMNGVPVEQFMAYGSPVQDLRKEFAYKYEKAHKAKIEEIGHCEACGITAKELKRRGERPLETHHVKSCKVIFDEGLDHSLVYDPANLIVLCRVGGKGCHWKEGHFSRSWAESNPNVRRDSARHLKQVQSKL